MPLLGRVEVARNIFRVVEKTVQRNPQSSGVQYSMYIRFLARRGTRSKHGYAGDLVAKRWVAATDRGMPLADVLFQVKEKKKDT